MGRQFVLVCLLFVFIATVLSQTTDSTNATTSGSTTEDATTVTLGPQTTWLPSTDFRCYVCDNEPDNDVCNGVKEDEEGDGTLETCDTEVFLDPVCFTFTKFNERGNGWSLQKGCMDYEECKESFYSQMDDPVMMSCVNAWYYYNPPPMPGNVCTWCCWKFGKWDFDKCNAPGYLHHWQSIDGGNNHWDHAHDRWPGHEREGYPLEGEPENGVSGLRMTTSTILSATMLSVLGALSL